MSTSVPTPADIIESFPELVPKITGPPTYASLKSTRDALKANAFSFATTLGGGNHGYLGLVLPFERHSAIVLPPAGQINSWEDPAFLGIHPNIPAGATSAATANIVCQHTKAKRLWQEWQNIHAALKQQLISSTEPMYLRPLQNSDSGFSNVNLRDMLSYLFTAYGQITPQALADNNGTFKQDWDPNTPFKTLIDQIETCQEFATDGSNPYTDQQILDNAFNLVYRRGMFFDDCKEWNKRPQAHKTWDTFKQGRRQPQPSDRDPKPDTLKQPFRIYRGSHHNLVGMSRWERTRRSIHPEPNQQLLGAGLDAPSLLRR